MQGNNRTELMRYRLNSAKERLDAAKTLYEAGEYKDAISRSYYAMFTAVRGLLAMDAVDFSKHAGVISYFQKEYIKSGRLERKYSRYLTAAFQIRNNADYADFYIVSKNDVEEQIQHASELIAAITDYVTENPE